QYAPILINHWLLLADLLTNSSHGNMNRIDPGRWEEDDSNSPANKITIDQIVSGFTVPETQYEYDSCLKTDDSRDVDWHSLSDKGKLYSNAIKEAIDRRKKEEAEVLPSCRHEMLYQTHLQGVDEETKCLVVATSLFYNCLTIRDREREIIDDPEFLHWLFE
ncbi:hypothetical protein PMAYCL1PPCAC_14581, partial [Pristionchus mayeri]